MTSRKKPPAIIKTAEKALDRLRRPGTKLVRMHSHDGDDGFYLTPAESVSPPRLPRCC